MAEFPRGHAFFLLEYAVEIGEVIESATVAYVRNAVSGVHEGAGGIAKPDVGNILGNGAGSVRTEEAAARTWAHAYERGKIVQLDVFGVMGVDLFFDSLDPAAFRAAGGLCKGTGGKFLPFELRELVKDLNARHHLVETV